MSKFLELPYDTPLTIRKGGQVITWIKKHDGPTFKIRRMYFKGKKLAQVSDSKKLGTADAEELRFRLDTGWKRV
jgi:hypothetical protein